MAGNKIKILLVDDDEMIRIYFRDIFWIHGLEENYEVMVAQDTQEAEKIISDSGTRPDLIFLDLTMPLKKENGMETTAEAGLSFIQRIKNDANLRNIKVVVFTGHDDRYYREMASKYGADEYFLKSEGLPQHILKIIEKFKK